MSFALKPINPKIQIELNNRSKILSRDSSAINMETVSNGDISTALQTMNARTTWIRWISGEENPIVILGGLAHYDDTKDFVYDLAKGFDKVYIPPNQSIEYNIPGKTGYSTRTYESSIQKFQPLAGVKSVTTGFEGATKSVRKVTIEWTVFNLDELETLTPHFLWPGKWCMLEMGWNFKDVPLIGLYGDEYLSSIRTGTKATNDFNSLEEQIYANKGNYECITGVISNFNYTLREDGGFDCTTTLTTHGISLLDATINSSPYAVEAVLDDKAKGAEQQDKELQKKSTDKFKHIFSKLGEYFRTEVSGHKGEFKYFPNEKKLLHESKRYRVYGDKTNANFFLIAKYEFPAKKGWNTALEKDCKTWVRWGWIEDNIISKYLGFASFEENGDFKETKLQFRSIDDVLETNAQIGISEVEAGSQNASGPLKESVRIISHKHLLTTDIYKFILVGKTNSLSSDISSHQSNLSEASEIGTFLDNNLSAKTDGFKLHKFDIQDSGDKREGYLRNVYFNVEFLNEKIQASRTLRHAIDSIWGAFNAEYQQYWDFKIVGNEQDLITIKIVDNNNARYNVSEFKLTNFSSIFSCYKFPTWTKESIVKSMDYSVTIPSSQTAVAALSGGEMQVDQPAERHKGDIGVQQYQKFLQKSFKKNKNKYFENTDRIAGREETATYGLDSANPDTKLAIDGGKNIKNLLAYRGSLINIGETKGSGFVNINAALQKEVNYIDPGNTEPSPFFAEGTIKKTLYNNGILSYHGTSEQHPKESMWESLHSKEGTAKTVLFDLLNGISEIKLTIDGIAGIFPGDAFTSDHLPNHLLKSPKGKASTELPLVFQTTNVEQELSPDGWTTTISGMPRLNHNLLYDKKPKDPPTKEDLVNTDFKEFIDTRNILGIGGEYLQKMAMFNGIFLPLPNDPHFYMEAASGGDDAVIDPRINGEKKTTTMPVLEEPREPGAPYTSRRDNVFYRRFPMFKHSSGGVVAHIAENGKSPLQSEIIMENITPDNDDITFGWFADGTGGDMSKTVRYKNRSQPKGGTKNTDHPDWAGNALAAHKVPSDIGRMAVENYSPGRNRVAKFTSTVEQALWFSMYNGILFAIPPIKCRDKNIPNWSQNVSEDGTYKNMSYHLFKGHKKSHLFYRRKKLTDSGQCEYTDEYMKEFNDRFGEASGQGYAPCVLNDSDKDRDLFDFRWYKKQSRGKKGTFTGLKLTANAWHTYKDLTMNLYQVTLTKKGVEEFRKFFTKMYEGFAGNDFIQRLDLSDKDKRDEIINKGIFGPEAQKDIFDEEKGIDKWVREEIDKFLKGMMKEGIIVVPTMSYLNTDLVAGYGRPLGKLKKLNPWDIWVSGEKQEPLQELYIKTIKHKDFDSNKYSAKLKEILAGGFGTHMGFRGKYGKEGPVYNGGTDRSDPMDGYGPFFYTQPGDEYGEAELGIYKYEVETSV